MSLHSLLPRTLLFLIAFSACADQQITAPSHLSPQPIILASEPGVLVPGGSYPTAINNAGWVVGGTLGYYGDAEAFLWNGVQSPQALGFQIAYAINAAGDAVGTRWDPRLGPRAVIWSNGTIQDLGSLASPDYPGDGDRGVAINSLGHVVGNSHPYGNGDQGGNLHPFLWKNGQIQDLGTFGTFGTFGAAGCFRWFNLGRFYFLDVECTSGVDSWGMAA